MKYLLMLLALVSIQLGLKSQQGDTLIIQPRAFRDSTVFTIKHLDNDTVTLIVYNRWGEEIKSFYKDTILSGDKQNTLYGEALKPETYSVMYEVNSVSKNTYIMKLHPTGVTEMPSTNSDAIVFPNPATTDLNITSTETIDAVEILDLEGKIIIKHPEISRDVNRIDVQDLAPGVYIVKMYSKGKVASKRIEIE